MVASFRLFTGVVIVAVFGCSGATELPDFIHVCKLHDPKLVDCFTDSAMALKPYLATGVPEYNIPSLEPLVMEELIASENSAGLKITANNVKAFGASDFFVSKVRINMETQKYDADVDLPHLYIEAQYAIDGRILLIPIRGNGPMKGNFTNCKGRVVIQGELFDENDVQKLRFTSLTLRIKVGNGNVKLDNLFGGEKVLGEVVNGAINTNFDAFVKELLPVIEKALARVFLQIANNIVQPFTYQQLFPLE